MITGFIFTFSANFYPRFFSYRYTGTLNASNFYEAKNCDLIIFEPYGDKSPQVGDIVCYVSNVNKGSGKIVKIDYNSYQVERGSSTFTIAASSVVGKQVKIVPVVGFLFGFIGSVYGAITFTAILVAYIAYLTFSRINYEDTDEGKKLYQEYVKSRAEKKKIEKMFKKVDTINEIDSIVSSILENDFEQNKASFEKFAASAEGSKKDNYKYILYRVHDAYVSLEQVNKSQTHIIKSLLELMCEAGGFDMDMEYMLVDLILKIKISKIDRFNDKEFISSAEQFINTAGSADMLNFSSVLYILLKNNSSLRTADMQEFVSLFIEKLSQSKVNGNNLTENMANSLIYLLKL